MPCDPQNYRPIAEVDCNADVVRDEQRRRTREPKPEVA